MIKKICLAVAACLLSGLSFAADNSNAAAGADSKIRIGLAVLEPMYRNDTAKVNLIVSRINGLKSEYQFSVAEFKAINLSGEIERTVCASVERYFAQVKCSTFPVTAIPQDLTKSKRGSDEYKAALQSLARKNAELGKDEKVDAFLVLHGGPYMDERVVVVGTVGIPISATPYGDIGIIVGEEPNLFFERKFVPTTFAVYKGAFYEATEMEMLATPGAWTMKEFSDLRVPRTDLQSFLDGIQTNTEIEQAIRKHIADAGESVGRDLDLHLWGRFKDQDPWEYIRKRRK